MKLMGQKNLGKRVVVFLMASLLMLETVLGNTASVWASQEIIQEETQIPEETQISEETQIPEETQIVEEDSTDEILGEDTNDLSEDNPVMDDVQESDESEIIELTAIDETIFPDRGLQKALKELTDLDGDGYLSQEEIDSVTVLDLSNRNIYDLAGLELFINLQELDCSWNHLTEEKVQAYSQLEKFTCYNNTYLVEQEDGVVEKSIELPQEEVQTESQETTQEEVQTESQETTQEATQTEIPWKFTYISMISLVEFQEVELNELNFPDEKFRLYIEEMYDVDGDKKLSSEELKSITSLNVSGKEIVDLTGISYFKNLLLLDVTLNQLQQLNVQDLIELRGLYCKENQLQQLDVTVNTKLKQLECDDTVILTGWGEQEEVTQAEAEPEEVQEAALSQEQEAVAAAVTSTPKEARTYTVTFNTKGGNSVASQRVTAGNKATNPGNPSRRKYTFVGWYRGSKKYNFNRKVNKNITLTAKWRKVSVKKSTLGKISNPKHAVLNVKYKKVSGAAGYDVQIALSKNFKNGLKRQFTTKLSYNFKRVYKDKTYYVRVRAYKIDSTGKKVPGKFSKVKKIKITQGRGSVEPSKTATTIQSVKLTSKKNINVHAYCPNYVKSVDSKYYLFSMSSAQTNISGAPIAETAKRTNTKFDISLNYNTADDRLQRKFAIAVRTAQNPDKYQMVSVAKYITNPEVLATAKHAFPTASTKKGLQVNENYISDAVNLGVKNTTYNMCLDDMIATSSEHNSRDGIPYSFDGQTYWFSRGVISSYDNNLNIFKQNNMVVSAIVLLRYRSDLTHLMASSNYQNGYYALNTSTEAARKQLAATFTFLAQRYATDGRIANWIIGNEVNNYGMYNYTGSSTLNGNAKTYADSFRLATIAIRSVYSNARVYISLDHLWNTITSIQHGSKAFLNRFVRYLNVNGSFPFNIAFHPYPSPLTAPEFWRNTNGAINNSSNSPAVTMGNISVLTNYVKSNYGSSTRIILSEQGFTSVNGGVNVEQNQAAAIAYAYYLSEFNDMIDAFILHRHIDHQAEIGQGLNLGLWNRRAGTIETPGSKKYAYDVYKYMDTAQYKAKTKFAWAIIGKKNWKLAVPGFNASRFK